MTSIYIVPVNTIVVDQITVSCVSLVLFKTATFVITSYDSNSLVVKKETLTLTEQEYSDWRNSTDQYILDLVKLRFGYTVDAVREAARTTPTL